MTTKGCISYIVINGTIQLFMARSTIPIVSPASGEIHLQIFQQHLPSNLPPHIWRSHDEIPSVAYEGDTPWKAKFLTRNSKREEKHRSAVLRRPVLLGWPHDAVKNTSLKYDRLAGPSSEVQFYRWLPLSIFLNKWVSVDSCIVLLTFLNCRSFHLERRRHWYIWINLLNLL